MASSFIFSDQINPPVLQFAQNRSMAICPQASVAPEAGSRATAGSLLMEFYQVESGWNVTAFLQTPSPA
jgi:2-keto-3-deoxy-6-phosphogluconate aldolase